MSEQNFTCDGVYHYYPNPEHCGHKEGVICTAPADDPAPDLVEQAREFAAQGDHGVDEYWLAMKLADFAASIHAGLIRENRELKEKVRELEAELRRGNSSLDEALNSGNGTYKP